jgi:hypothetical protein
MKRSAQLTMLGLLAMVCHAGCSEEKPTGDSSVPDTGLKAEGIRAEGIKTEGIKTDGVAATCAAATTVSSQAELVAALGAAIASLGWQTWDRTGGGVTRISADIKVTGSFSVLASEVQVPASSCPNPNGCRPLVFGQSAPTGVTLEEPDTFASWTFHKKLTATDTTFRVRPVAIDGHPSQWGLIPYLEIREKCDTPCPSPSLFCAVNNLCYPSYYAYCLTCLGNKQKECGCSTVSGPVADGTQCSWWASGDVECSGTCKSGLCTPTATSGTCSF